MRKYNFPLPLVQHYAAWTEFVDQAAEGYTDMLDSERSSRSTKDWFRSSASFDQCVKLARQGWPEGLKAANELVVHIESQIPTRRAAKRQVYSAAGPGTLDIGRYLLGHPEPYLGTKLVWSDKPDPRKPGKIVKILCNIGVSGRVSTTTIYLKGAMVAAMVNMLERTGRRVELQVGVCYMGRESEILITVKRPQDVLDMERVVFSLAHAGFSRGLIFSLQEQTSRRDRDSWGVSKGGGYGYPGELPSATKTEIGSLVYVRASSLDSMAEGQMLHWVYEQLKAQGIAVDNKGNMG